MNASVTGVHRSPTHQIRKETREAIVLVEGFGVEGDTHGGELVKHRSRAAKDPTLPNLRQVHLIHEELYVDLRTKGHVLQAGEMGENVTTRGIDLLNLPTGTQLRLGDAAVVRLTGLRNPCSQLDDLSHGLKKATLAVNEDGSLRRLAGVMSIVVASGTVHTGDAISIEQPPEPQEPLKPV